MQGSLALFNKLSYILTTIHNFQYRRSIDDMPKNYIDNLGE